MTPKAKDWPIRPNIAAIRKRCKWQQCLATFTRKFGRFRPEKGRILLSKHQEVTGKFGRHVVTDRKVWPSFEGIKPLDTLEERGEFGGCVYTCKGGEYMA